MDDPPVTLDTAVHRQEFERFVTEQRSFNDRVLNSLDAIGSEIRRKSQTNWGVVFAGLAVVVAALVYLTTLVIEPIRRDLREQHAAFVEHAVEQAYRRGRVDERLWPDNTPTGATP